MQHDILGLYDGSTMSYKSCVIKCIKSGVNENGLGKLTIKWSNYSYTQFSCYAMFIHNSVRT